jgi:murein DD-endopeptidase MepM/ murein hydrolase activator NlpD
VSALRASIFGLVGALLLPLSALSNSNSPQPTAWPVANGQVLATFGGKHHGIDIGAEAGTPVHAFAAGTVLAVETTRHCGQQLRIRHADGAVSLYCNLSGIRVAAGDAVARDSVLGAVASAAEGRKPHLHFELKIGDEKVDPLPHLPRMTT